MHVPVHVPKLVTAKLTDVFLGVQLARCGHLLYLDYEELEAVQEVREGDNCCMLFSPVCRHLLMVLDLQALGVSAPAWCIPDCTLRSTVHDFDTLTYKRLHTTHALIMMSLNEDSVRRSGRFVRLHGACSTVRCCQRPSNQSSLDSLNCDPM